MTALTHLPDRFVLLPYRKGEKDTPDWFLCSKYIAMNHSSNNTTTVDDAIKSMAAYHNTIVKTCTADSKSSPSESFIEHTLKEYCRLVAMAQAHLPLNGGKISKKMHFVWCDSFDDWGKYDTTNANAELISCIYNLAASYVYVATGQAQTGTVDGVKDAFKNYQNAAGYYTMVENLSSRMPPDQLTKGDMKKESLQMLIKVCLAQAHHCGYLKAEEAMKGNQAMLSKIAMQGAKMYEEAHSMMKASTWYATKNTPAKEVEVTLLAARYILEARASMHLAVVNEEATEMGNAIAYYVRAKDCLRKLPKMPTQPLTQWVNSIVSAVNSAHDVAEKANVSVYYARVPKEVPEPEALPRPLGQALPQTSFVDFVSKRGDDPFFGIVPAHIASAAAQWREKQRSRVQTCNSTAVSARKKTTKMMQQLGVMAAIQTLSGEAQDRGRVPEPLRSNILKVRGDEGVEKTTAVTQKLVERVQACKQLQSVADSKMQEIKVELALEKKEDDERNTSYGEKMWRSVCPPAEETADYQAIMAAYSQHKADTLHHFVEPFKAASTTLDANLRNIARLDWKMSDLDALMPFVESKEARQQSSKVMVLVEQLKTTMSEKERLENEQMAEQRELMDIIESDAVVFGLSAVEGNQRDAILAKETQRISDAIEHINEKGRAQGKLVPEAEKTMEELSKLQSTDPVALEIQTISNGLENACNVYTELLKDLGTLEQYMSKALENIDNTLNNAKSFRAVRKMSADDLQMRLDAQIAQKMGEMRQTESEIEASRHRQQALQSEIATLQGTRMGSANGGGAAPAYYPPPQPQPCQAPPPPQQQQYQPHQQPPPLPLQQAQLYAPPPPIMSSAEDRPPSYAAIMGSAGGGNSAGSPPYQPPQYQYQGSHAL